MSLTGWSHQEPSPTASKDQEKEKPSEPSILTQRKSCFTALSSEGKHNLEVYLKGTSAEVKGFLFLLRILTDKDLVSFLEEGKIRIKRIARPFSTYVIRTVEGSPSYIDPRVERETVLKLHHEYCVSAQHYHNFTKPLPYTDKIAVLYLSLKFGSLVEFHKRANHM